MLLCLPTLFGSGEVLDKAKELFSYDELLGDLAEFRQTYEQLCRIASRDRITVDLGLVSKADYYTGIIFRGYIEEYGQAVDTLIDSFGGKAAASVGFAANINAIADAVHFTEEITKPEVLIFADEDSLIEGILHCAELTDKGLTAEYYDGQTLSGAKDYAAVRGIKRIDAFIGTNIEHIDV